MIIRGNGKKILMTLVLMAALLVTTLSGAVLGTPAQAQAAGRTVTITSCVIQGGNVVVSAAASQVPAAADGVYYLYADEVYQDGPVGQVVATAPAGASAQFAFPLNNGTAENNLMRKFIVAVKQGSGMVQVSDEHYITNPEAIATQTSRRNDHGIKGILPHFAEASTFKDLGVAQMVYNLYLGDIVGPSADPALPTIEFPYCGAVYQFNTAEIAKYDAFVKWCSGNGFQLTMTIINNKTSRNADLIHPMSRDGHVCPGYAMNTKEPGGTAHLKAIATFLAARYSGTDGHGQVDNWVIGNEVNARTEWYHMSSANLELNVSEYVKAFRIFYNGIKSVNANARVYNSIDQEWGRKSNPGCFLSREYLDRFTYYMSREGNIDWGLSFHPYNSPLYDPYAWNQPSVWVRQDASTPYITIENIDVLTSYMSQPAYLAPNGQVRSISLSEIGYTSSFGEDLQAASIVYAYLMAASNPHIDAFILFREMDDAHEMQSHIAQGLKRTDGSLKPAYACYKALGTGNAASAKAIATQVIGQDVQTLVSQRVFQTRAGDGVR
ncbi:MAG: hypothetical protein II800_07035 [Lachnospiraceae bacterium]|nr:hypothetical protein [Lachnospiraceae bacterium]